MPKARRGVEEAMRYSTFEAVSIDCFLAQGQNWILKQHALKYMRSHRVALSFRANGRHGLQTTVRYKTLATKRNL